MTPQTPYLVEAASVGEDGTLRGTSLRAYECTVSTTTRTGYRNQTYTDYKYNPTGVMYVMNPDSSITKKKTRATLSSKYVSSYYEVDSIKSWSYCCRLFSSPELALFSKLNSIYEQTAQVKARIQDTLRNLESFDTHLTHFRSFADTHPEFFI